VAADDPRRRAGLNDEVDLLLRDLAPQVLGSLTRRYGDVARAEDAVQEAMIAALRTWSRDGVPEQPRGWLATVAARRYLDQVRADSARRRRELAVHRASPDDDVVAPPTDGEQAGDDTFELLFRCCHPELARSAQVALTPRAVGGLTTAEIAAAFLVPETTMAQRIVRAKQRLRDVGARFGPPAPREWEARLAAVLHVLYLIFSEGYVASRGPALRRPDLTGEALRLTRRLHAELPETGEVTGLLALMRLTEARAPARVTRTGDLVPLDEQDRSGWDRTAVDEADAMLTRALATAPIGPYQVQAAIAAVHAQARSAAETDWPQVLALYDVLDRLAPGPAVSFNRAVAVGMARGPQAGLDALDGLPTPPGRLAHRALAVRGHLLELAGERPAAAAAFRESARLAESLPERRHLLRRAASLG
jgi:RNA polymerase sigma factor (sigma-70 family)